MPGSPGIKFCFSGLDKLLNVAAVFHGENWALEAVIATSKFRSVTLIGLVSQSEWDNVDRVFTHNAALFPVPTQSICGRIGAPSFIDLRRTPHTPLYGVIPSTSDSIICMYFTGVILRVCVLR